MAEFASVTNVNLLAVLSPVEFWMLTAAAFGVSSMTKFPEFGNAGSPVVAVVVVVVVAVAVVVVALRITGPLGWLTM